MAARLLSIALVFISATAAAYAQAAQLTGRVTDSTQPIVLKLLF